VTLKYNIVATLGDKPESIFVAIREFPTEKIFLISNGKHRDRVDELKGIADKLRIGIQVIDIKGSLLSGNRTDYFVNFDLRRDTYFLK
jgi:hypothetical protein